jgi:pyridoxamine 5'-phosphate oxidase family protein
MALAREPFTPAEGDCRPTRRLGRPATVAADGAPRRNPVGFTVNPDLGTIDRDGHELGASWTFRHRRANPQVAPGVGDIVSSDPWEVRGVGTRGTAEALGGHRAPTAGTSRQVIAIRPRRVISRHVDPTAPGTRGRDVEGPDHQPVVA